MLGRVGFRERLFLILLGFALVPSVVLTIAWGATSWFALPYANSAAAWDSAATSGSRALAIAKSRRLTRAESIAVARHEQTLNVSLTRSKQTDYLVRRMAIVFAVATVIAFGLLILITSRVAGHLSRNLSRPLQELVGWTDLISRAQPLPDGPSSRGAPEFDVLRERMRDMSSQLDEGRRAALEAERLSALRESARQVAHELKNPLTPIKFAIERLRREGNPGMSETIDVLSHEATRLEDMARSFAQFGRLPEGPIAPVDVGELARYTARSSVPSSTPLEISVGDNVPLVHGHHEALARALSNVIINAVEACKDGGSISVDVRTISRNGDSAVALSVKDTGCGIPANRLARIWDPYVTHKPGGTGLGLAIARQTIIAHDGDVAAESEPGKGTLIRFILPVRKTPT
jgi:signal transduction histidine kinase